MLRRIGVALLLLVVLAAAAVYVSGRGWLGQRDRRGDVVEATRPAAEVEASVERVRAAATEVGARSDKQILFGDFHVHTTYSADAFALSLPIAQGEGAHPPADACDFARFCSQLDFWSINDHAENMTPAQWDETVASIRECNAVVGGGEPDTVAFLGWEWTNVGTTPDDHWGHKNVVMRGVGEGEVPARPISSRGITSNTMSGPGVWVRGLMALAGRDARYHDFARFLADRGENIPCEDGVDVKQLPRNCVESAQDPATLFRKLDEWGLPSIVIPHGTTWGFYTPPGSSWDKQLTREQHDPDRQSIVEIFSGHGNSEELRPWRAVLDDGAGGWLCPEPSPGYLPACWRAGEIIRERCLAEGTGAEECDGRAAEARLNAANAGVAIQLTVPGVEVDDWLDAGQCTDCFLPAFNTRPGNSVQYMLARKDWTDPEAPRSFRFGVIGSSDNHFARPGTGYKEFAREGMTESVTRAETSLLDPPRRDKVAHSTPFVREDVPNVPGYQLVELERQTSFFMTGGLVAAHSEGRDRDSIWQALERKEVYATSGPRILLWFDLVNAGGGDVVAPMGSEVRMAANPRFEVRAVGSFEEQPGCPASSEALLGADEIERLCKGECHHPSDVRRPITRIEIVRVRPQVRSDEPVEALVEDPWRSFECPGDGDGCRIEFEDARFAVDGRETIYYARAIEAPSLAVNADNLRCTRDDAGQCIAVDRCGTAETEGDDCLAENEERAWSSPIYVDPMPL
jgi:hypothetical protein